MLMKAGTVVELEVARKVDFGYFLTDGDEDILLHQREVKADQLEVGDKVQVFLYHDHQNRLSATMHQSILTLGEAGWLRVIDDARPELGVFLELDISRDLLLPYTELPNDKDEWPRMGDYLFTEMSHDQQGRIIGKLANTDLLIQDFTPAPKELHNQTLVGTVYKQFPDGAFLVTGEGYLIFIPRSEMIEALRLGQETSVRITYVREEGRLNGSTRPLKQQVMGDDAEKIMNYIKGRGGSMPYSDKSSPEMIDEKFQMSKAAFKRALGKLMKEKKVHQEDGWTFIKE